MRFRLVVTPTSLAVELDDGPMQRPDRERSGLHKRVVPATGETVEPRPLAKCGQRDAEPRKAAQ